MEWRKGGNRFGASTKGIGNLTGIIGLIGGGKTNARLGVLGVKNYGKILARTMR